MKKILVSLFIFFVALILFYACSKKSPTIPVVITASYTNTPAFTKTITPTITATVTITETATINITATAAVQQTATMTAMFITQWGSQGSSNGQFNSPTGIAIDGSGNIYVIEEETITEYKNLTVLEHI